MTTDEMTTLAIGFLKAGVLLAAPAVAISAVIGVAVGVVQTATQVNEPSVSYAAKGVALFALFALAGPALSDQVMRYTRASFEAIAHVTE